MIRKLMPLFLIGIFILTFASCVRKQAPVPVQPPAPVTQPVQPTPPTTAGQPWQPPQQTQPTPPVVVTAVPAPAGIKATNNLGIEYLDPVPMVNVVVKAKRGPVRADKTIVPIITWGADEATVYANGTSRTTKSGSIFVQEGLQNLELSREDYVVRAVEKVISGETPYFRGTMDMVISGMEALRAQGIEVEVIYLLSRSTGGDTLVVRQGINTIADLKGKTIGLQLYGPHMLYLATVLHTAGLNINDVNIRWLRELTVPPYETPMDANSKTKVAVDPATAFERDPTLDAVFVITPDMLVLTSGDTVGKGGDGSVKGAKKLLSTATAGNVIYDVYAVRKDYLEANRQQVHGFVHGLLRGQEELVALFNAKDQRKQEYNSFLKTAAEILRDNPQAIADIEGMYLDMTFAGYPGNVRFFTDKNDLRRFEIIKKEAEQALIAYRLLSGPVSLSATAWDYSILATGLKDTSGVVAPRFDPVRVEQYVKTRELTGTTKEGVLLEFPIYFKPNQNDFSADLYKEDFAKVINLAATYPGAVIIVEGHADPMKYLQEKQQGLPPYRLDQTKQAAKNLSLQRAIAVRDAIVNFSKTKNINLDVSQFTTVGAGIDRPQYQNPVNEKDWLMNMRVSFQIIQVEAELNKFAPVGK